MEMTDLNASQRLRTAKLRRPLPTRFGTVGQPAVPWRPRHGPAGGPDTAPARPRRLRSERIATHGSFLTWRIIGYRLRSFHFPTTHE